MKLAMNLIHRITLNVGMTTMLSVAADKDIPLMRIALPRRGYESIPEIGEASGYNLSLYEGKRRFGIEAFALNCNLAKKNYGVDMFGGMWSEFLESNSEETYDLIFTSHVLEHIVNPMQFTRECALTCNRYMFVEAPCFDIRRSCNSGDCLGRYRKDYVLYGAKCYFKSHRKNEFAVQSLQTV